MRRNLGQHDPLALKFSLDRVQIRNKRRTAGAGMVNLDQQHGDVIGA